MPKVYIVNAGGHDVSPAKKFGELVFITDGRATTKFNTSHMVRLLTPVVERMSDKDFILVCGMTVANMIFAALASKRLGVINLLIYSDSEGGRYVHRRILI